MEKPYQIPIQYLKGIGPKRAELFNKLGVYSIEDLLYYFPRRYQDRTKFTPIAQLKLGEIYTIKAEVMARGQRRSFFGSRMSITEAAVADETGKIFCVWFNQPYLKDYLEVGTKVIFYGKVDLYGKRLQMSSPDFEILKDEDGSFGTGGFFPVYSLPDGLTQRFFRNTLKYALEHYLPHLDDFLPYDIRSRNNLHNLAKSLLEIHFPQDLNSRQEALRRLSFEEFFLFQMPLVLRKRKQKELKGIAHKAGGPLFSAFISRLPFQFTSAQAKVMDEIKSDMASMEVMQRLLQGDVGSGKTVVASAACVIAIDGGYQAAFMAPTEILAKQHYEKIGSWLKSQGSGAKGIEIGLLTSSLSKIEKEKIYAAIKAGRIDLIIGTHALLEEGVKFENLGLVVIDEQHKFGVGQRALLPAKGPNPDVLIMTATPIPRTLAITLYGDLDISVINEMPPGRLPVQTLHFDKKEKKMAYALVKKELEQANQAYIIYPVIEESYALDMAGAQKMYKQLKAGEFKSFRLGLIHGRLKQKEQDELMSKFKNKEIDVLVATTILEVGIDIPTATCMAIEDAQRFGLAQLHQLRGRIGRGSQKSICVLVSAGPLSEEAQARMEAMVQYADGFHIAEEDLRIRGPGEFFGRRQHGLAELKVADPLTQLHLLKKAREEVISLLKLDPYLAQRQNQALKEKLLQRFPEYEKLILVA